MVSRPRFSLGHPQRRAFIVVLGAVLLVGGRTVRAQDVAAEARAERPRLVAEFPDAFAPVIDNLALPRVLLIGDSISIGYTPAVRELLQGIANVHRIPDNGGPTTRGLAMLDEWLGKNRWDVIHFNFGLHDIARLNDGQRRTSPLAYAENLHTLVARLQKTGARLIFATTTPVPDAGVRPPRRNEDALACNEAARRLMNELGVAIDDLYAAVLPRLGALQQPANVHFTPEGYRALATRVVASIREELEKK